MQKIEDFEASRKPIMEVVSKDLADDKDLITSVNVVSQAFVTPLVFVYEFVGDKFPERKEFCDEQIKRLNEFYGIR